MNNFNEQVQKNIPNNPNIPILKFKIFNRRKYPASNP
jgi:hypothetical protein